ncbi:hypothetical protein [Janibacter sp. GS2]|uniref:hypothetical protein n=1 Tax=Janibacter sp. GS2 TaxID=3442646 RepID=UPI003EB9EA3F
MLTFILRRSLAPVVTVLLAVLAGAAAPATAEAETRPTVPPEQYVVGGCRVVFTGSGEPSLAASSDKPCVGVQSVARTTQGDLDVVLTPQSAQAAIRLMVSPSTQMIERGIVAGATGGRDVITLRMYDDRAGKRVDLRTPSGRDRVAGTAVHVGWTKAGGADAGTIDPGHNALGPNHDLTATSAGTVPGGCVLRMTTTGVTVHANTTHRCIGVSSVGISSTGRIRVTASPEQRGAVVNVQGDADETLTTRGIGLGVSASASTMNFSLYDSRLNRRLDLRKAADLRRVSGSTANVWLSWTKTTARPGSPRATTVQAADKYGPYRDGSAAIDSVVQRGCTVDFSGAYESPRLAGSYVRLCTGVTGLWFNSKGEIVLGGSVSPIVSATTVGSRSLTDYGIRVGVSGGGRTSTYRFYSWRLGRTLDLSERSDRRLFERSGSSILIGWSHPTTG